MNIICSKCGGTDILCEAMIDPNTKKFSHYTDESFLYGWCNDCWKGTILTEVTDFGARRAKRCEGMEYV